MTARLIPVGVCHLVVLEGTGDLARHMLVPPLDALRDEGVKVSLATDGRMSGGLGQAPAAIDLSPEAAERGPIAGLRDGDLIRLDARSGRLNALVDDGTWVWRVAEQPKITHDVGLGRAPLAPVRTAITRATAGAAAITFLSEPQACERVEPDASF